MTDSISGDCAVQPVRHDFQALVCALDAVNATAEAVKILAREKVETLMGVVPSTESKDVTDANDGLLGSCLASVTLLSLKLGEIRTHIERL